MDPFHVSFSQHAPRDILVKTAHSPVSVRTVPRVIRSLGAAGVPPGSAETCVRMVSYPLCPRQHLFVF